MDAPPWLGGRTGPGVCCVLAPNPGPMTLDGTNTWVITHGRDASIIDPGPADETHLRAAVHHARAAGATVRWVLLTHHHADHSEGARRCAELAGGVGVRALDPQYRLGSEGLADGDVIDLDGRQLRVVETPGHTRDSVSFLLDGDNGVDLLAGDTVLGRGTSVIAHPDGALGPYLDSLARLRHVVDQHGHVQVLTGHGPALADAAQVLRAYELHRRERLVQVQEAVAAGARTPRHVVQAVYTDVPQRLWPTAELTVAAQLDYLRDRYPGLL